MKHTIKKALAMLMAMLMLYGVYPATAMSQQFNSAEDGAQEFYAEENVAQSENMPNEKYLRLLNEGALVTKLPTLFEELYGSNYTSEDLKNNYAEIFEIQPEKMDETVLGILVKYYEDKEQMSTSFLMDDELTATIFNEQLPPEFENPVYIEPLPPEPFISEEILPELTDVIDFSIALDDAFNRPEEQAAAPLALEEVARPISANSGYAGVTYISRTATSITVDLWYHTANINNYLRIYDPVSETYIYKFGQGKPAANTGRYTITGLVAGVPYTIAVSAYYDGAWRNAEIKVKTDGAKTPSISVISSTMNSVTVNAVFPSEGIWGNKISYITPTWQWVDFGTNNKLNSGIYTITGFAPGQECTIRLNYYDHFDAKSSC